MVIKVRRNGLAAQIAEDTAILGDLAALVDQYAPRLRAADPVGLVQKFARGLHREMDVRLEAQTIRRFRAAAAVPCWRVPWRGCSCTRARWC